MSKRGQITIFIIVGIIIFSLIVIGIVFTSRAKKAQQEKTLVETILGTTETKGLKSYVDNCLESSLKGSIIYLGNKDVKDYDAELEQMLQTKMYSCVNIDQLNQYGVKTVPDIKNFNIVRDKNKILVTLTWPLTITSDTGEKKVDTFTAEYELVKNCCVPVDVDSSCNAKDDFVGQICVIDYNIQKGDSLKTVKGDCLAC